MALEGSVGLGEITAWTRERTGVVWTLEARSDLNANLVRFGMGGGIGEHVNDEVEVKIVGIAGLGSVRVNGEQHHVSNGTLTFVPRAFGAPPGAYPRISPISQFTVAGVRCRSAVDP
jgi:quercetin dioxygenase-like cupin family protein